MKYTLEEVGVLLSAALSKSKFMCVNKEEVPSSWGTQEQENRMEGLGFA